MQDGIVAIPSEHGCDTVLSSTLYPTDSQAPPPRAATTVAIVGLGLLGASLGLRLRRRSDVHVLGWARRRESVDDALQRGMIDAGSTAADDVLSAADLTVICVPPEPTVEFVQTHADSWRHGTVVTDVGSTKQQIVRSCRNCLGPLGVHFVGSHPMAGSEQSGLDHASADLYEGAVVFVTDVPGDDPDAVQTVTEFWLGLGCVPHRIGPAEHDGLTSRTSHVLHLLAAAASNTCLSREEEALLGGAGALRDMTRIAGSSPDMWLQIVRQNRSNVLARLSEVSDEIDRLRQLVGSEDWASLDAYLTEARTKRRRWFARWAHQRGSRR